MRTITQDLKPQSIPMAHMVELAQELAWIRAAGFATITRIDRFYRRIFRLSRANHLDASEVYSRITSMSLEIREDDEREALNDLAIASRKAV